jgi:hypothetical protein
MDITSPFKPDVYRVSAVILLPGLVASFPWIYWFLWPSLQKLETWKAIPIPLAVFIAVLAFGAGLLLEDIGSRIEADNIDKGAARTLEVSEEVFASQWESYLRSTSGHELVAHKYLGSLVTRFKFELSMMPAVGSASLATFLAAVQGVGFDWKTTAGLSIFSGALLVLLYDEVCKTAVLLHKIRRLICEQSVAKSA